MNYYNEFDPAAAAWLRELIARKLIPDGIVDERSITEIHAPDLQDFTQCHFFAGIGGWSLALQLAGVSPDTRLWTGSCPCQPFSSAGKGEGKDDERHLWPVFFDLIKACRPPVVFGEQVASALVVGKVGGRHREEDGPVWLDGVFADLESAGYATGATVLGAHSVGAPHIRQRLYWVAHTPECGSEGQRGSREDRTSEYGAVGGMADTKHQQREGVLSRSPKDSSAEERRSAAESSRHCAVGGLGDSPGRGLREFWDEARQGSGGHIDSSGGASGGVGDAEGLGCEHRDSGSCGEGVEPESCGRGIQVGTGLPSGGVGDAADPACERNSRGFPSTQEGEHGAGITVDGGVSERLEPSGASMDPWRDSIWLPCRDGKHRRVPAQSVLLTEFDGLPDLVGAGWGDLLEATPGLAEAAKGFPLASGDPFKLSTRGTVRPGLLKGAGNAIVPQVAAMFIEAFYEVTQ